MCLCCVLNSVLTLCERVFVYALSILLASSSLLTNSQKSVPLYIHYIKSLYRGLLRIQCLIVLDALPLLLLFSLFLLPPHLCHPLEPPLLCKLNELPSVFCFHVNFSCSPLPCKVNPL